jgi:colanic acid biosynthesis glycosyl transferase WcaI
MLMDTDIALVTQQRGSGSCFFPSKLLATLAHERPVLAVADEASELARALENGGFGLRVEPDDPERLASALIQLSEDPEQRRRMGAAGRRYVEQFEMGRVQSEFAERLEKLALEGVQPERRRPEAAPASV